MACRYGLAFIGVSYILENFCEILENVQKCDANFRHLMNLGEDCECTEAALSVFVACCPVSLAFGHGLNDSIRFYFRRESKLNQMNMLFAK